MKGQSIVLNQIWHEKSTKIHEGPVSQQGSCDALHGHSAQNRSSSAHTQLTGPPQPLFWHHSSIAGIKIEIMGTGICSKCRWQSGCLACDPTGLVGWSPDIASSFQSVGHPGLQQDVVSMRNMRQQRINMR